MLAMADQEGNVRGNLTSLAMFARETVQDTKEALSVLSAPDPESGQPDMEGRRIVPIDGGWHLVTHPFYREQGMSQEAREYWRQKKRVYRAMSKTKKDKIGKSESPASASVLVSVVKRKKIVKEKPSELQCEEYAQEIGQPRSDGAAMFLHFEEHGWPKNWRLTMAKWKAFNYLPSQKQRGNGQSDQMSPKHRENKITHLNERKQKINRLIKDPNNPPEWAIRDLAAIDEELKKL